MTSWAAGTRSMPSWKMPCFQKRISPSLTRPESAFAPRGRLPLRSGRLRWPAIIFWLTGQTEPTSTRRDRWRTSLHLWSTVCPLSAGFQRRRRKKEISFRSRIRRTGRVSCRSISFSRTNPFPSAIWSWEKTEQSRSAARTWTSVSGLGPIWETS